MKRIQYLSILLLCVTLACNEAEPETTPTDYSGLWSGQMSCSLGLGSESISFDIQANPSRCDACYTLGFFVEESEEAMRAKEQNGQLVLDRYIINEGGTVDVVSIEGTGRMNGEGKLEFDFKLQEMSNDNFGYTCSSTLTRQ